MWLKVKKIRFWSYFETKRQFNRTSWGDAKLFFMVQLQKENKMFHGTEKLWKLKKKKSGGSQTGVVQVSRWFVSVIAHSSKVFNEKVYFNVRVMILERWIYRLRAAVIDHCSKLGQVQPTLVWQPLIHGHYPAACGMLTAEPLPLEQQPIVFLECPWRESVTTAKLGVLPRGKNTVWERALQNGMQKRIFGRIQ